LFGLAALLEERQHLRIGERRLSRRSKLREHFAQIRLFERGGR